MSEATETGNGRAVLHEIYALGNPSEGYAFQLLFNEMRCAVRFRV